MLGRPEEIAETILWMVKTGYVTNKVIAVDGKQLDFPDHHQPRPREEFQLPDMLNLNRRPVRSMNHMLSMIRLVYHSYSTRGKKRF